MQQGLVASTANAISADGAKVMFSASSQLFPGMVGGNYIKDLTTGEVRPVPHGSSLSSFSRDGRYVAINTAFSLIPEDTDAQMDIYVLDLATNGLVRANVNQAGVASDTFAHFPHLSPDGKYVAFFSRATNLHPTALPASTSDYLFVKNLQTGEVFAVNVPVAGVTTTAGGNAAYDPSFSPDGRYLAFEARGGNLVTGATQSGSRVYLKDLETGTLTDLEIPDASNFHLLEDASAVVFRTNAIYIKRLDTGEIRKISDRDTTTTSINLPSYGLAVSDDGSRVAIATNDATIVPDDLNAGSDVFLWDAAANTITLAIEPGAEGATGYGGNLAPSADASGRYVVYEARGDRPAIDGTNRKRDIYLYDRTLGTTTLVSASASGVAGNGDSSAAMISANGRYVSFVSTSTNLAPGGQRGLYRKDLVTQAIERISSNITAPLASISGDGNLIAYQDAVNQGVVEVFVRNMTTGDVTTVLRMNSSLGQIFSADRPYISNDGKFVTVAAVVTNPSVPKQVYVCNLETGQYTLASATVDGVRLNVASNNPTISGDGRYVAFEANPSTMSGGISTIVYVKDMVTSELRHVSSLTFIAGGLPFYSRPQIDNSGRYVAFETDDAKILGVNIRPQREIVVVDLLTGGFSRPTATTGLRPSGTGSTKPALVGDGTRLLFQSSGDNYVADDNNHQIDIFGTSLSFGPSQISLSGGTNRDEGTITIGTLSFVDVGSTSWTIALATGDDSASNAKLQVVGDEVRALAPLDFETDPTISFRIRITDETGEWMEQSFILAVNNLAPTSSGDNDPAADGAFESAVIGTAVGITASATDPGGGTVLYSLTDDADGRFAIDANSGVISVAGALNYADGSHVVVVRAEDPAGNFSELEYVISVLNAPPVFDPVGAIEVAEAAAVNTILATLAAADLHGGSVAYALVNDAGGRFAIDATSGVITVASSAIDFESSGGSYTIRARAEDAAGAGSELELVITVLNQTPGGLSDADLAANVIAEGASAGDRVGVTAIGGDPAGGTVTYYLVDSAGGRFAIDATSGIVTVAAANVVDYESSGGSYVLTIGVRDATADGEHRDFVIAVVNRPPSPPSDADATANLIAETTPAGAAVGVTARSSDILGGGISYLLIDSAGGRFSIDATTGVVRLANRAAIEEEARSYSITVRAVDAGGAAADSTFTIQVQHNILAVAAASGTSRVVVYDAASRVTLASFNAFAKSYKGGVRVATGDVNGDGVHDVVVTTGSGVKTKVRIYDGTKLNLLAPKGVISPAALIATLTPFGGSFKGGAHVAVADLNGDHYSEVTVGSGAGRASEVRIYDGATRGLAQVLKPFSKTFTGGVTVAVGDLGSDGRHEIIVGQATGVAKVRIFDSTTLALIADLKPLGAAKRGVDVAVGDVNGDGCADLVVSAGAGGAPTVRALSGLDYALIADFLAFKKRYKGGVQVTTLDADGDGRSEILVGDGPGGIPAVRSFQWTGALVEELFATHAPFKGGMFLD